MMQPRRIESRSPARSGSIRLLGAVAITSWLMLCGGCQYALEGRVVEGETAAIVLVQEDDARLRQPGVSDAVVSFTLDPSSLRPKSLGSVLTDPQGRFRMELDELGAGFLEYELGAMVRAKGYRSLWQQMDMPAADRRLLIVISPGEDRGPVRPRDVLQETLDIKRQIDRQEQEQQQ